MAIHNPITVCFEDESGNATSSRVSNKALHVTDVGIPTQRHNRYLTLADGDTWPGNETYKVTWTQAENVRRYRVRFSSATADTPTLKIVEDGANEAQAEAWLATATTSATADVEYIVIATSNKTAPADTGLGWSEWQELSKDPDDLSLTNLYFLGDTNEAYSIWVEAE